LSTVKNKFNKENNKNILKETVKYREGRFAKEKQLKLEIKVPEY